MPVGRICRSPAMAGSDGGSVGWRNETRMHAGKIFVSYCRSCYCNLESTFTVVVPING